MSRLTVVIADDEEWIRSLLLNMISWDNLGLEVVGEANSGSRALSLCLHYKPDILITDIKMPGINGLDLISSLKKKINNIEVIIISGYEDFSYAQKALYNKAAAYLLKPINKNTMEGMLAEISLLIRKRTQEKNKNRKESQKIQSLQQALLQVDEVVSFEPGTDRRIVSACEYIKRNFRNNPTLTDLSCYVNMNLTYFSEIFKKETGIKYSQYLLSLKMGTASRLLLGTNLKIGEIADVLGYADPNYFVRVFKKYYSRTPKKYRSLK